MFQKFKIASVSIGLLFTCSQVEAGIVDLTTIDSLGVIDGAVFYQFKAGNAGTGVMDSFVRYKSGQEGVRSGYNTDGVLEFDTMGGNFTHSVLLNGGVGQVAIPIILIGGTLYREFAYDINEVGGDGSPLSLDTVEIYLASDPDLTNINGGGFSGATLIYDMDGAEESTVLLDQALAGSGSGVLDMLMYIPESLFAAVGGNPYVYLYSSTGGDFPDTGLTNSDGFEEWAFSEEGGVPGGGGDLPPPPPDDDPPSVVPEPSSIVLLGMGAVSMFGYGWRRRRMLVA